MYTLLIVEDDSTISNALQAQLAAWGYNAIQTEDFKSVSKQFAEVNPHLVLLDISLPFFNGYYWCTEIRKHSTAPIVFISSASDNLNLVMAMNMGGDDFISKPFDFNVLLAKIQAILRRTYDFSENASNLLTHRGAELNLLDSTLTYQGHRLELSKNEFRILTLLLENKGAIVSRDSLMIRLWETDSFVDENTLTVNVTRLRKRLDAIGLDAFILTKKGLGYIVE
ncbi:MAG: two-component system, OmpR family, response regulator protein BraR/BceR [Clostridiales bacterium]|nr:two-component system, OmpR family, response regulator protein BraR/BceR [Clostridiales bacterium]